MHQIDVAGYVGDTVRALIGKQANYQSRPGAVVYHGPLCGEGGEQRSKRPKDFGQVHVDAAEHRRLRVVGAPVSAYSPASFGYDKSSQNEASRHGPEFHGPSQDPLRGMWQGLV